MQLSYKSEPHSKIDYYLLPSGIADVFLHKNESTQEDEESNIQYVAEEVYFQTEVSKKEIESNFEHYWNNTELIIEEPSVEERLQQAEDTILFLLMGGA